MQTITQEELDRKSWKYIGYKDFCEFSANSDEFFAVRRFDELHCRLLLALQDRLSNLEEELDTMDERLRHRGHADIDNGSFRKDQPERTELLEKIGAALHNYDTLLSQYIQLRGAQRASSVTTSNIKRRLRNFNAPIEPKEIHYLDKRDLVSISPQAKSSVQQIFEQKVGLPIVEWLQRQNHTHRQRTVHNHAVYLDDDKFEIFTSLGLYVAAITMLAAPMWILASMKDSTIKLIVITAFLFIFVTIMNWGIVAKPFEILAAAAG
ncbi:hypothetical protein CGCA056_v011632 [Colletotrichum aenigma]|uniref:uncharacterized protein n=1 Tax=Colletotrichum aenigma TaxID=1215731 RepID=UPI0018730838|nr:uncharacterized protein CGCA056_v011632 [Colletotrichum aenigma]KAF5512361.1 hypothetical protein CGCA056_v011632 [Colletotrichum aenigma]